jgi:hypothetical protein
MSNKQIATVMAVVLLLATFSLAQSQSGQAPPSSATQDNRSNRKPVSSGDDRVITIVLPSGIASVPIPGDADAWVVQIISGGGVAGTEADTITMTSAGDVVCNGAQSATGKLLPTNLDTLSQLVVAVRLTASTSDQLPQRPTSMCSDCYSTTLTLSRREANHKVKTYMTTWDTVTRAHVPKDLDQLYETVVRLAACQ